MAYDYSKVGDKNVQIRNLDTDEVFTYYQADVGALPDAIIDIWGEDNIRELAGTPDGAPTDNANNVRYYHERFSDQTAPAKRLERISASAPGRGGCPALFETGGEI